MKKQWRQFRASTHGTASAELVLMAPLMIWCIAATVVFFDGYRSKFNMQKSATTIADFTSRALVTLDPEFIDGMSDLYDVLTPTISDRGMRITEIVFEDDTDSHFVVWSEARGSISEGLVDGDLIGLANNIPPMADLDRYIIVELSGGYSNSIRSAFGAVLTDIPFGDMVLIAPRFTPYQICYQGPTDPDRLC